MSFARLGSTLALLTSILAVGCAHDRHPAMTTVAAAPVPSMTPSAPSVPPTPRIELSATTTPTLVRLDKDQEIVVRVRVHGLPVLRNNRPPLDLALVVDTSGSMEGAAIEQARTACGTLIDSLADGDSLSVVTFGSKAKVIVPSVRITKETRQKAKTSLREVTAEGTTDMAGGLSAGLAQIRPQLAAAPNAVHRVVLLGDGVPNDPAAVLALADVAKSEHVAVTTLGLGNDFDETLMTALAQRSSGTFHFVDDASRVGTVFKDEIARIDHAAARASLMELTPGPGVTIQEVVGTSAAPSGRSQFVTLGDLSEGQTRDVFVRLTAKGRQEGKTIELLDAHVFYTPAEGGEPLSSSTFVKLAATSDAGRLKDAAVVEIEHAVTSVRVADGTVKAIALAREGDLPNARKLLEATLRLAREGEKKFSDKALGTKVNELTKLRRTLPSLVPPSTNESALGAAPPKTAPSADDAMDLRAAHGEAMKTLQGQ